MTTDRVGPRTNINAADQSADEASYATCPAVYADPRQVSVWVCRAIVGWKGAKAYLVETEIEILKADSVSHGGPRSSSD